MAKLALINRQDKREKLVKKFSAKRAALLKIINDQSKRHMTLRGLFEFKFDPSKVIPLDAVEHAAEIVKRFATGAMSLGSHTTEAHAPRALASTPHGATSQPGQGGGEAQPVRRAGR